MNTKHALASKTIWINLLTLIGTAAGLWGVDVGLDAETKTTIAAAAVAVVNILLRFTTDSGIHITKGD